MIEGSDGDFHLFKVLIALVSSSDKEVAAVACFDIGEFVRYYPNGRAIAKRLGGGVCLGSVAHKELCFRLRITIIAE